MLELYQHEACEDSGLVRQKLSDLGLSYVVHNPRKPGSLGGDVLNEQTYEQLLAVGGEDRLPLFVDHRLGEVCYDEHEVVAYLDAHYR